MEYIKLHTTKESFEKKISFLRKIEQKLDAKGHFQRLIFIGILSIPYPFILIFADNFGVKFVGIYSGLFVLSWAFIVVYYIWYFIKRIKNKITINSALSEYLKDTPEHFIYFDEVRFGIQLGPQKTEYEWEYFVAYLYIDDTILLFPEGPIYSGVAFTSSELGEQHFLELINIVEPKLNKLQITLS